MQKQFILSVRIEDDNYSKNIILDKFNSFEKCDEWANWLKEIYEKVKEKR